MHLVILSSHLFFRLFENDRYFIKEICLKNNYLLSHYEYTSIFRLFENDRDFIKEICLKHSIAIKYLPSKYKNDRDFIKEIYLKTQ